MHGYGPSLRHFIHSCGELNLEVYLSEMDVDDSDLPANPQLRDAGVAKAYADFLSAVLAAPNVRALLTWGVHDPDSWLNHRGPRPGGRQQRPLLFDADFRPKPALAAVTSAIAARPPHPLSGSRL